MTLTNVKTMARRGGSALDRFGENRALWYSLWAVLIGAKLILAYWHPEPAAPDETTYTVMAKGIIEQHQYLNLQGRPTGNVIPGYPLMLAAVMKVSGGSTAPMYFVNALLTIAIAWAAAGLLYVTTRHRGLSRLCMVIVYLYPPFVTYPWHLLTEIPYTAALMLFFLFWEKTRQRPLVYSNWFFMGLFTVTSFMIRPVMFLLTPFFFAWPLILARLNKRSIIGAAIGTAVVFALWMPWVYRNHKVFGGFIPLATTSGMAFYTGTLSDWTKWSEEIAAEIKRSGLDRNDELVVSKHFGQIAKQNIARDRVAYFKRITLNSWRFWPTSYSGWSFPKSRSEYIKEGNYGAAIIKLSLGGVNVAFLLGMVFAFAVLWRQARWWPYMFVIIYFHVMHALIMPIPRYSLPLTPMVIVMTMAAIHHVWLRSRSEEPAQS